MLCFVLINSVLLNFLCVWISLSLSPPLSLPLSPSLSLSLSLFLSLLLSLSPSLSLSLSPPLSPSLPLSLSFYGLLCFYFHFCVHAINMPKNKYLRNVSVGLESFLFSHRCVTRIMDDAKKAPGVTHYPWFTLSRSLFLSSIPSGEMVLSVRRRFHTAQRCPKLRPVATYVTASWETANR